MLLPLLLLLLVLFLGAVLTMGCDKRRRVKLIELGCCCCTANAEEDPAAVDGAVVAVFLVAGDDVAGGGSPARPRLAARARNLLPAWATNVVGAVVVRLPTALLDAVFRSVALVVVCCCVVVA